MSRFTGKSDRCTNYCGVTCVNGSCPNALAEEYPEYDYQHCTCDECWYYQGCNNCEFQPSPMQTCDWLRTETTVHMICPRWKKRGSEQ